MRFPALPSVAVAVVVVAGCGGGGIEGQVKDGYGDYADRHGFTGNAANAENIERVECIDEATREFDGWCKVHLKGMRLTYDVPYRDDKPLWGESGPMEAPAE